MIIRFGIPPLSLAATPHQHFVDAIRELLRSHRIGHHLAIIPRDTATWLLENISLNSQETATLKKVRSDYTQSYQLLSACLSYIDLVIDLPLSSDDSCIPIKTANAKIEIFDKATLLVEDMPTDGAVMDIILRVARTYIGIPNVSFKIEHGSGQRSPVILSSLLRENRIVVSIVDSDKFSPESNESILVDRMKQSASNRRHGLAFCFPLPCRETENLLPIDVYREIFPGKYSTLIATLLAFDDKEREEGIPTDQRLLQYVDMKFGVSRHLAGAEMSAADRAWLDQKCHLVVCPHFRGSPWFGDQILKRLLETGAAVELLRQEMRSLNWRASHLPFFEQICWFFAAARRSST